MVFYFFRIAIRNLLRSKAITGINLIGLILGMVTGILLLYYVFYERSYDIYYPDHERIYRFRYERTSADGVSVRFASCCAPAASKIREIYPEVEKIGRIYRYPVLISYEQKRFFEERVFFAEKEIFDIFSWPFITGDPHTGIEKPNTAFISKSTSEKYFGDQDPIGKQLRMDHWTEFEVTGVFEDMPGNSHIKCDILLSFPSLISMYGTWIEEAWGYTGFFTYLVLRPEEDLAEFSDKLANLVEKEFGETLKRYNLNCELPLQPLTDIHLNSHYMQEYEMNGNRDTVNFLFIIALFVLLIAWINYINLTTARSLKRAKEVSLRKISGASRSTLILQFLMEVVILNLIALLVTFILFDFFLPVFSSFAGLPSEHNILGETWLWSILLILFSSGILISGLYPAVALSTFKPIEFLRIRSSSTQKEVNLRKALVVFQFLIALSLITWTLSVFRQISFMHKQDMGIRIADVISIRAPRILDKPFETKIETFKSELLKIPDIKNISIVSEVPGRQIFWDAGGIYRLGSDESKNYQIVGIDYEFASVFDVTFASGRNFSREFPSDSSALILNETAVKWMGFPDNDSAIGEKVDYWGDIYTIVGVINDYHQQSPKTAFEPHIYRLMPYGNLPRGFFAVNIKDHNISQTMKVVKKKYDSFFPDNVFEYFRVEDYYNQQFDSDNLLGNIFASFSFLAILITILGILGLTSYMILQRTKEFSIRIILGARIHQIFRLFVVDFLKLIIIAMIISIPLSVLGIKQWLTSFEIQMNLSPWLFVVPFLLVTITTGITIASLVIKVAKVSAAENLRYE